MRHVVRQVEAAGDARGGGKLLGELREVGDEFVERVVGRIHRPDDFVERPRETGRRGADPLEQRPRTGVIVVVRSHR